MLRKIRIALALFVVTGFLSVAFAADQAPEKKLNADEFVTSLHFQKGKINLPGGVATLDLPDTFRYLPPADAERVLVNAWGNPPGNTTLGMIFPADISPLNENSWGVVVTYDEDGHVKDDDADNIKYDELLKKMKEDNQAANEDRKKDGYPAITLVGWAENPSYDKRTHKFYWAKEFSSEKANETSLNYNIRVLGRKGVLVLNAVASMDQIAQIKQEMQHVVAFTEFTAGNGYNDFDNKTDKIAEYGLAALVAGGVAAKLGFFTKIFAMLLAFKKVLLVGLAAMGSGILKFFKRKKDEPAA